MNFKLYIFTFLLSMGVTACSSGENDAASGKSKGFKLEGTFKTFTGINKVKLEELMLQGMKPIDSTQVDDKGHFVFQAPLKDASFYILRYNGGEIPLYLDSMSSFSVEIDPAKPDEYTFKGSTANDKLKEVIATNRNSYKKLEELQRRYPNRPESDSAMKVLMAEYNGIMTGRNKELEDFVNNNTAGPAGIFAALFLMPSQDVGLDGHIKNNFKFYDAMDKRYSKEYIKQKHFAVIHQLVDMSRATAIGSEMPDFSAMDTAGKQVSLKQFRGKYVLIDFWASWCGPCRMENPNVVKAYAKYHPKGFEILGFSLDQDKNRWIGAIKKDGLNWWHISELKGWESPTSRRFGVSSIPFSILVDKEGKILATNLRGEELDGKLKELMGE